MGRLLPFQAAIRCWITDDAEYNKGLNRNNHKGNLKELDVHVEYNEDTRYKTTDTISET